MLVAGTVGPTEFLEGILPSLIVSFSPDDLTILLLPPLLLPVSLLNPFVSLDIVTIGEVDLLPEGLELSEMLALALSLSLSFSFGFSRFSFAGAVFCFFFFGLEGLDPNEGSSLSYPPLSRRGSLPLLP